MTEISRRGFLKALGIGAAAAAASSFAPGCTAHLEEMVDRTSVVQPYSETSLEKIADILKEVGVGSDKYDFGGNKTLILIQEVHVVPGKYYAALASELKKKLKIDGLFFEGVLSKTVNLDPFLDYYLTKDEQNNPEAIAAAKKLDFRGYYAFKNLGIPVYGLEDPVLHEDGETVRKIKSLVYSLDPYHTGYVDQEVKKELKSEVEKLKIVKFPFDIDYLGGDLKTVQKMEKWHTHYNLAMRNKCFSQIIEETMQPGQTYLMIVGRAHFFPPYSFAADFLKGHGTLQDEFKKIGVNVVETGGNDVLHYYAAKSK